MNSFRGDMMNKKGAIELSMTTIIVIVLGITLLSLGILWIRNSFSSIQSLTESQFQQASQIIDATPTGNEKLNLPIEMNVKSGQTIGFKMYLLNDGSTSGTRFNVKIDGDFPTSLRVGVIGQKENAEVKTYEVTQGETQEIDALIIVPKSIKSGTFQYTVEITDESGEIYEQKGFFFTISSD